MKTPFEIPISGRRTPVIIRSVMRIRRLILVENGNADRFVVVVERGERVSGSVRWSGTRWCRNADMTITTA